VTTEQTSSRLGEIIVAAVIIIATAAGLAIYISPTGDRDVKPPRSPVDEDLTESVVVSVVWKPTRRLESNAVHILVTAEDTPLDETLENISPYNATFHIPKGARVKVVGTQPGRGQLDCLLQINRSFTHRDDRTTPGAVTCRRG
jgi:hypothetical protein